MQYSGMVCMTFILITVHAQAFLFLLYRLYIISVNVFHVETGKQTIHKKEKKLGHAVVV